MTYLYIPSDELLGALPADSLVWCRVLNSEIIGCDTPVTIAEDEGEAARSVLITQGALGDNHFVSAMRGWYVGRYRSGPWLVVPILILCHTHYSKILTIIYIELFFTKRI